MTTCKFCIYTHPVNSKFTIWQYCGFWILFVYSEFFVPFEKFSLIRRRHYCQWKAVWLMHWWSLSSEGSLTCHTYCDTGLSPKTCDIHTCCQGFGSGTVTVCFNVLGLSHRRRRPKCTILSKPPLRWIFWVGADTKYICHKIVNSVFTHNTFKIHNKTVICLHRRMIMALWNLNECEISYIPQFYCCLELNPRPSINFELLNVYIYMFILDSLMNWNYTEFSSKSISRQIGLDT